MHGSIREKSVNTENRLKSKLYARMPDYIFSNDLFESWIRESLNPDSVWIDAGCGSNSLVSEFENLAPKGTGIDAVRHPGISVNSGKFINAELEKIPLDSSTIDVIVCNMVIEHIENIGKVLGEYHRVLKTGGRLIFRTTNKMYPSLLAGHLLPKKVKDRVIFRIFGIKPHDIFETRYRLNTYNKIRKTLPSYGFRIRRLEAVEDLHMFHPAVFELSYMFYKIQKLKPFKWLRNCIVCLAEKT